MLSSDSTSRSLRTPRYRFGVLVALARFVLKLTCRSSSASTEVSFSSSFRFPWSSFRSVLNSSACLLTTSR